MLDALDIKGLGIVDPISAPLKGYSPGNNSGEPRFRVLGNKMIIYISQTLIKEFTKLGEIKEYCPRKIYEEYMINKISWPPTNAMKAGSYFETHILGSGANGAKQVEFHKKGKKAGSKSVDQIRIDEQVFEAKVLLDRYNGIIADDFSNTQVKQMRHYEQNNWANITVMLTGEADLISPLDYQGIHYDNVCIDYKLTSNLHSKFGDFGWGQVFDVQKGERIWMDLTQATVYHLLFDMPFAYWVFDYKAKEPGPENKLLFINHNTQHPNPVLAQNAKFRLHGFNQTMNLVINEIMHNFQLGWPTDNSSYSRCEKCGVMDCLDRNKFNQI